ncbi:Fatty acid/sphingolipid desaturase [Coniochaeta hoffmannii]|uniref:Delta 8-(E)-sphingolipid desaturase n=1 Tax=Coniochaeta hoffmannii TaxID=91930 RepID=A0AA38VLF4_9PEZI|nr:Fatty acid/sphingolipid desaturase [Coniochaeta hoffmannii]
MDAITEEKTRTYPLMTRREVEHLIAEGRNIIIVNQHVLKVDAWIKYHPGGDKSIAHEIGRDATDEVTVLHSPEAQQMMNRYRIGRIEGRWRNFIPPIQGGRFRLASDSSEADNNVEEEDACPARLQNTAVSSNGSSRSTSPVPSPVFDVIEHNNSGLRARHGDDTASQRAGSVTSLSSVDEEEFDGMAFLESETRKEIKLDLDRYPSLDAATQEEIVRQYRLLYERIKAEGLFQCNYTAYAIECVRYTLLFAGFLYFLRLGWYTTSAAFLGGFWHQLVFSAHDAGHMGITHDFHTDSVIGIIIADFFGGLSLGWWKRNHNVHHIVTNFPEHDPDIEHMPFFAISHRLLGSLRSTYYDKVMEYDAAARFFIAVQHYSYYFILLFGRFNLYRLSFDYLLMGRAPKKGPAWWHWWLEIAGQAVFWTWFGYGVVYKSIPTWGSRVVFILVSHAVTAPLHLQITLSHFAMSTADLGPNESFPQKMLRTTMDVDCPQWLDFFHGGLQFQAIHHLYPRIPRHNLRRTQKLVQEFCDDVGIPYALYGFVGGNKEVIGRLAQVSRQAAILAKCQRSLAVGEDGHGHGHAHHH